MLSYTLEVKEWGIWGMWAYFLPAFLVVSASSSVVALSSGGALFIEKQICLNRQRVNSPGDGWTFLKHRHSSEGCERIEQEPEKPRDAREECQYFMNVPFPEHRGVEWEERPTSKRSILRERAEAFAKNAAYVCSNVPL